MDGISTFKIAVKRAQRVDGLRGRRRRPRARRHRPVRLPPGQRAHPRAVGERLELDPAKVADYIAQLGNTSAASIPLDARRCPRGRPPAPGPQGAARRDRRGLHVGRRRDGVERAGEPPRERHRARHRRVARASAPRSRKALAADGWAVAVNYRSDEAGANATVEGDRGGRRHGQAHPRRRHQRRRQGAAQAGRGRARPRAARSSTTRAWRATDIALQLSDEDWDMVIATNLIAGLPAHARRAARR